MILLALPALAQDPALSTDTQLLRPTFAADALPGFDDPGFLRPGAVRVGGLVQYERDPLVLYKFDEDQGAVVANRDTVHLGVWWQPAERVALRLGLPLVAQWAGEVPTLSDDGVGVGNFSGGLAVQGWTAGALRTAATFDVFLPTSPATAWVGDASIRGDVGLVAALDLAGLTPLAELGATLRPRTDTGYDYRPGSELTGNLGLRYAVWPDRVSVGTGVLARLGFSGGASVPVEWVTGLALDPVRAWQVDLGVGRGLTGGYGTTQLRLYAGLTWSRTPEAPPPPAPPPVVEAPPSADLTEAEVAPPPEPAWEEGELAKVEEERIVIRDPIQFELGTDRILPVSQPTLEAIAGVLAANPRILHVVIEGHASEEGTYLYNYDLSLRRAVAIFRALVEVGVHPARLSCRGMGEVAPVAAGVDEASLALNRRVVFHIVRQLAPGEPHPDWGTERRVPWTGAAEPWTAPVVAPPPAPPPPAEPFPDFRDDEDDGPLAPEESP